MTANLFLSLYLCFLAGIALGYAIGRDRASGGPP